MIDNLGRELSPEEFEVLQYIVLKDTAILSQLYGDLMAYSALHIKTALHNLINGGFIRLDQNKYTATMVGVSALEPYRVRRAIILAAGMGMRMRPITEHCPKPMVQVNGKRIIETQLDALLRANITDITIVRGYLGSRFNELLNDYPILKFVDNPYWESAGAIMSVSLVSDLLEGAYVMEGDLFIRNGDIIRTYEYRSSYCGVLGSVRDDWYFCTDDEWQITKLAFGDTQDADNNYHKFVGIMYWAPSEARQLQKDLRDFLKDTDNHHGFIESVPFKPKMGSYNISARHVALSDVVEVDTYVELQALRRLMGYAELA